jgi:predicted dehydrogenase
MQTRRNFIGNVATGLAGSFATGRVLGANDHVRVGVIGAGDRGTQLVREVLACPDTEIAAFADVYQRRLEDAAALVPGAKTWRDYREMLSDPSIDAVIVATPQHLHADHFAAAMEAGKHVYQEKTMAFTLEQAKRMRVASQRAPRQVVQIGHQSCSAGHVRDASDFLTSGGTGRVTAIRAHMYRNTPHGKAPWSRPVFPDMTPERIDWKAFLGGAPAREFDANRFVNWRYFTDTSGGNVHENMSHQLAFWYRVMDLRIPWAVTMTGGIYRWKDGREVPDTMSVAMEHPEHELQFTWDSGFGSNHPGVSEEVLGTDGTIARNQQIRYLPQRVNRPEGAEMQGQTPTAPHAHVRNFFDCIRGGGETNCPVEIGFRVSVACRMAVESYRLGRTVYWDAAREEIV